jgi:hypothetical protein
LEKAKPIKTPAGLAMNIKKAAMSKPIGISGITLEGNTSKPNVRNKTICISQACPS